MRALLLLGLLACLLSFGGCGNGQELIVVTVGGTRAGGQSLEVLVQLDGQDAMNLETFALDTTDFGLQLPPGTQGTITVSVAAVDGASCIVAFDSAQGLVDGSGRLDLGVTLATVSPPKCPS